MLKVVKVQPAAFGKYLFFLVVCWSLPSSWPRAPAAEEEACDAWVLWSQPGAAGAYAEALVATTAFLSGFSRPLPVGASGVRNTLSLKRRLVMILSDVENAPMTRSRSWNRRNLGRLVQPQQPIPDPGGSQPERWVRSAAGEARGP